MLISEGYLSEIFSSIQGEGGTVRGGCFGKPQIFVRFSGCNLALGDLNSKGCFWCDSKYAQKLENETFKYEEIPRSQNLLRSKNPVKIQKLIKIIQKLITSDLHSISFTGGEPLYQLDFVLNLAKALKISGIEYPLYLETNGAIRVNDKQIEEISKYFKYCCCDIKDRSSKVASQEKWKNLVEFELVFINKMVKLGVETFAKIVVTSQTQIQDIRWICKNLSRIKYPNDQAVGLAIQPVFLENKRLKKRDSISIGHLNNIFYTASEFLSPESLTLSIQAHKFLKLL